MDKLDRDYLGAVFADLINYSADNPLQPVDPFSYLTPEGDSCLHIAAIRGDLRAVRLLLAAGLDPNLHGDLGNTPLHYARRLGNRDVVDLLTESGALTDLLNEFGERAGG
jgi:ankyrin repeat protein